ncbi:hypothetical protein MSNKSG1_00748 [Marinobacter santoriniensis NKSG1]|uniref:Uncharacterized protein n=1 Tax=Marinobacter santoriniensis NKSG1 TaxID=1288826 RepID=M7CU46_9GAMM|nr:hypothetical protein MSNKSG1_00748 [Marinobacter santoriniensis NKSG1]
MPATEAQLQEHIESQRVYIRDWHYIRLLSDEGSPSRGLHVTGIIDKAPEPFEPGQAFVSKQVMEQWEGWCATYYMRIELVGSGGDDQVMTLGELRAFASDKQCGV